MRLLCSLLAAAALLGAACQPAPSDTLSRRVQAARLVLGTYEDRSLSLHAVDPATLEDVAELEPLQPGGCAGATALQPAGSLLAVLVVQGACREGGSLVVRVLDLDRWQWRGDLAVAPDERPARAFGSTPLAWSADGSAVYVVTVMPSGQRRLWRLDVNGATAPVSVAIESAPVRLDVAPNGTGVYVLSGQAQGALLDVYDPRTLALRTHVPLPRARVVLPSRESAPLLPAVALAPDGSRYYVAHADEPILDVVDARAPGLERLERSVALRAGPSDHSSTAAWLAVSPDGAHLRTWRQTQSPEDDAGLQVVDTHSWQATTVDPSAMRLWSTLDGHWLVRLEPPAFTGDWRRAEGMRMTVLDANTREELATLLEDARPLDMGQFGSDRLYVQSGRPPTLVGYEVGTWRELGRRSQAWLVTASRLW